MVKALTRNELGRLIRDDSSLIVLLTASIFVLSGSLWAHFALSDSFFTPGFFVLWVLLHFQPFLGLMKDSLLKPLALLGFVTLQTYFYFAFYTLEMPYVPMAPLFFVITALSMPMLKLKPQGFSWLYWAMSWASVFFWMGKGSEAAVANVYIPVMIGAGISLFFQGSFAVVLGMFSRRLASHLLAFGPKQSFDEKRIQASKLQTVGEITASLLHEINNPLTNVNGYSHQIQEALSDPSEDALTIIRESNNRIKFNVDRIKDITQAVRRLVRPSSNLMAEDINVKELLDDALTLTKHHLRSSGIEVEVDFFPGEIFIKGNFTELSQVLVNLLSNARDAVKMSERKIVSIGFGVQGQSVCVWVQDSGEGIAKEIQAEVFKPFFTTKANEEGTGLGLYISQMIAERNSAVLEHESLQDRSGRSLGTRFTIKLPLHHQSTGSGEEAA